MIEYVFFKLAKIQLSNNVKVNIIGAFDRKLLFFQTHFS